MPELTNDPKSIVDATIIGAGPIGIEVHASLKAAGASVRHIEAGPMAHTMTWWAPRTKFFSSPERLAVCGIPFGIVGQDKATNDDYVAYLVGVARQLQLPIDTFRAARSVRSIEGDWAVEVVRSATGVGGGDALQNLNDSPVVEVIRSRNVILTIGNTHLPRVLGVPGEDRPHVSHYLADPLRYTGRDVLIVGAKNSAVEAAIRLYRAGAIVTMSYRREEFDSSRIKPWLLPELEWLIDKGRVRFEPQTEVRTIGEDTVTLERDGAALEIEADFVLLLTGYVQDQTLFDQLGLERIDADSTNRPAYDHATMQTSVPGIYVAGTACGGNMQRARVFIENSHVHADRICKAMTGQGVPWKIDPEMIRLTEKHEES